MTNREPLQPQRQRSGEQRNQHQPQHLPLQTLRIEQAACVTRQQGGAGQQVLEYALAIDA